MMRPPSFSMRASLNVILVRNAGYRIHLQGKMDALSAENTIYVESIDVISVSCAGPARQFTASTEEKGANLSCGTMEQ